jgi:squalene synthase HpnC
MRIPESLAYGFDKHFQAGISRESCLAYCQWLAQSHYENFTVVSWFLPKEKRQHFYNIYAYCRWSDDLADEAGDKQLSLELLDWWEGELDKCYQGKPEHPVFIALQETIHSFDIPADPFHNLLKAFRQDQLITSYPTYQDLLRYCLNSANPVGHLVLYLSGYRDAERQKLSDYTCTALQLTNFWQDVAIDLQKGRIYLPLEDMERYGYTREELEKHVVNSPFKELMKFEIQRTRELFEKGLPLCDMLNGSVKKDIELFSRGGMEMLNQIEKVEYDIFDRRPSLSKGKKIQLMLRRIINI